MAKERVKIGTSGFAAGSAREQVRNQFDNPSINRSIGMDLNGLAFYTKELMSVEHFIEKQPSSTALKIIISSRQCLVLVIFPLSLSCMKSAILSVFNQFKTSLLTLGELSAKLNQRTNKRNERQQDSDARFMQEA